MKKLALAVAVPLALLGAATFYTSTQIEPTTRDAVDQANLKLREMSAGVGGDVSLKLLSFERGLLSSAARYQIDIEVHDDGDTQRHTLLLQDHIEHGPFPVSRLTRGRLMPVAAQSHFQLERTPLTEQLFEAASGEVPLVGDVAIGYDGSQSGELRSAAFNLENEKGSFRIASGTLNFDATKDATAVRLVGELPEIDANLISDTGKPVRFNLRGIGLSADKQEDGNGFALGPSAFTVKHMDIQTGDTAVEIHDASVDEALSRGSRGLDQTLAYRVGRLQAQGQTFSDFAFALSLRNLEEASLKALADSYKELLENAASEHDAITSMTDAQQHQLQAQALQVLEHKPTLALDEFGFKSAQGATRTSVVLDLQGLGADAFNPLAMLASFKAEAGIDKGLVRDVAGLIVRHRERRGELDPVALQQEADAATDLFSGMALNSGWYRLEGERLVSSLHYANDQVHFNGREMSVQEFIGFAFTSAQGIGLLGQ